MRLSTSFLRKASYTTLAVLVIIAALSLATAPLAARAEPLTGDCSAFPGSEFRTAIDDATGVSTVGCYNSSGEVVGIPAPKPQPVTDLKCNMWNLTGCWNSLIIDVLTWTGSWGLTIGGAFLRIAGFLFDMLIKSVIIQFKTSLDTLHLSDAIKTGWTVFRDFANILIIGMFVFIAISIILGLKEFGQKRLIANVLVIAVLINFSLLFAKVVIDSSNFFAFQIYNQMAGSANATSFDMAGSFLRPMGITGVWDTGDLTAQIASNAAAGGASAMSAGMQAFAFGLVGGILLLAVAAVLLYGCFLIASRAILFIFLMLTAPIAFATYLIPSMAKGDLGWSGWWKSLINNAVFGPLLMLFLAVSLAIVNAAGTRGNIPLGRIITNPKVLIANGGSAWETVLLYIIAIGLLAVSFRSANKFAGSIGGFDYASAVPGLAYGGISRIGGLFGRSTFGKASAERLETLRQRQAERPLNMFERAQARVARSLSTSSFDALNTKTLGKTMKPSVGGSLLGKDIGKGGYIGTKKRQAAEAVKKAEGIGLSDKEVKKAKDAKTAEITSKREGDIKKAETEKQMHEEVLKNVDTTVRAPAEQTKRDEQKVEREKVEQDIGNLEKEVAGAIAQATAKREDFDAQGRVEELRLGNLPAGSDEAKMVQNKIETIRATRKQELDKETENIKRAQGALNEKKAQLGALDAAVKGAGDSAVAVAAEAAQRGKKQAEVAMGQIQGEIKAEVDAAHKQIEKSSVTSMAQMYAHVRPGTLYGLIGSPETDPASQRVSSAVHEHHRHERIKEFTHVLHEETGHDDHGDDGHGKASHAPAKAAPTHSDTGGGHGGGDHDHH